MRVKNIINKNTTNTAKPDTNTNREYIQPWDRAKKTAKRLLEGPDKTNILKTAISRVEEEKEKNMTASHPPSLTESSFPSTFPSKKHPYSSSSKFQHIQNLQEGTHKITQASKANNLHTCNLECNSMDSTSSDEHHSNFNYNCYLVTSTDGRIGARTSLLAGTRGDF